MNRTTHLTLNNPNKAVVYSYTYCLMRNTREEKEGKHLDVYFDCLLHNKNSQEELMRE